MGFIPINKEKTIRDKVQVTLDEINKLDPFDEINKIYIEDSLSGFMRGRTSQQTIIKLAKFNAVLTYCLEFAYGEIVDGINPMTARKHLFGKPNRIAMDNSTAACMYPHRLHNPETRQLYSLNQLLMQHLLFVP